MHYSPLSFLVIQNFEIIFAKNLHGFLQDIIYGAGWSPHLTPSIFKVKWTPKHLNPLFCIFSCAIRPWDFYWSKIPTSFLMKIYMDVCQDLIYGVGWSPRSKRSIFKVKRALKHVNPLFCKFSCVIVDKLLWWSRFPRSFLPKICMDIFKTLSIYSVGHHCQNSSFSRSNVSQSK